MKINISSFFTIILICLFLWPVTVFCTEVFIPPIKGKAGSTIILPINIDKIDNLAGIKFTLTYPKDKLVFKSAEKTKATSPMMHVVNDKNPGVLIIVLAAAKGIKGEKITILNLSFFINKTVKEKEINTLQIKEIQLLNDKLIEIKCKIKISPIKIVK